MRSDSQIIELLKAGRREGMVTLFDRYYKPLVLFADGFLHDLSGAEDVVQEQFVKLWEEDYLLKIANTSLGAYLYSAVRNRCYSYIRQKDVLRRTKELDHVDIPVEWVADVDEERIDRVMKEMEELPGRTRQVVECVMLRNLKYREVAEELGISINTVKFLLKEGTKRLRDRLKILGVDVFFFFWGHISRKRH